MYIYIFYSRVRSFGSLSTVASMRGLFSLVRSSPSFQLFFSFLTSIFSFRRSSSRYSRSGILKPPCRDKTGLWPTRASARLVASQKYNVSTVCLTHRIYIHSIYTYRVYDVHDVLTKYFFYDFRDQTSKSANGDWKCVWVR